VNSGGNFDLGGAAVKINGLASSPMNAGGIVNSSWGAATTLTLGNGAASASYSGSIQSATLGLIKVGTGTQTLTGINSYGNGTTLSNGVLSVSSLSNIGGANAKVTFAGGLLRISGTTFTNFNGVPLTFTSAGGGLDLVESGATFTLTNDVPSGTSLTKTGNGSLSVSGSVASLVTDNRTRVSGSGSVAAWTLKSLTGGVYTPTGIEAVTGTLTLEGNYTFDLNADGTGDKLTASGAVTMNSIVVTIAVPANLTDRSKVYTLVEGSSLSGDFSLASVLPQDWKLKKEGSALLVRYVSPGTMVSFF
jgi:autotransporter-associated beta strand protein